MKIVALVLAGGEGTRLYPLTAEHAKPALPFANGYRIVDFVLRTWSTPASQHLRARAVQARIAGAAYPRHGRRGSDESDGSIKVLLPRSNTLGGQFKGTADAVYQYLDLLAGALRPTWWRCSPPTTSTAWTCARWSTSIAARRPTSPSRRSACRSSRPRRFGVLSAGADGRVREFREKPKRPTPIAGDPALRLRVDGQLSVRAARCWSACCEEARRARRHRLRPRHPAAPVRRAARLRLRLRAEPGAGACRNSRSAPTGATSARLPRSPPRSRTRWGTGRASTCGTAAGRSAASTTPRWSRGCAAARAEADQAGAGDG